MFRDSNYQIKRGKLEDLGRSLYRALDDPLFNGSKAHTREQYAQTGQLSSNPIMLETQHRPLANSVVGPRTCVLKIPAGLHAKRLKKALEDGGRALVPWNFTGNPTIDDEGRLVTFEVPWEQDLQVQDIPLRRLFSDGDTGNGTQPHSGNCALLGPNESGITHTLRLDQHPGHAHVLTGGVTGSGKSYLLRSLVTQFARDPRAQFILIDGKDGEGLGPVNGLHGQLGPLTTGVTACQNALGYAYRIMKDRNAAWRATRAPEHLSRPLYIVIDEFDLFTMSSKQIARLIFFLAKQGRTARVHLILGTQSPKADMWGGEVGTKGQFPIRIALMVTSYQESEAVLNRPQPRADYLLGAGDAHLIAPGVRERLQLAYAEAADIAAVTGGEPHLRAWPDFDPQLLDAADNEENASRALPFTVQESTLALYATLNGWGRHKVNSTMQRVLGYQMGSDRIKDSLLPHGAELQALWEEIAT